MLSKEDFISNKNKDKLNKYSYLKKFLFQVLIKSLIVIIIFISSLIYISRSDENKNYFKKIVYNNSLSFARIYNVYKNYLGDLIPFKNILSNTTKTVSSEKISYDNITKENNGYMLDTSSMYMVTSIKSGIVIKKENSKKYKTLITIQDKDGVNITYGMLENLNINLYDYVDKGEVIAMCNKKLYLIFEKNGKYLSYEKYL
mgnify:FL=1